MKIYMYAGCIIKMIKVHTLRSNVVSIFEDIHNIFAGLHTKTSTGPRVILYTTGAYLVRFFRFNDKSVTF